MFGLVCSWSTVINRTQRVFPMPSTEEPSKKFISWKDLQGCLVTFCDSFRFHSSWQPSLIHFKTSISSLQILGKPLLEEFQVQWPLGKGGIRENRQRLRLRLRPLASRFYTNKLKGVVHVHPPEATSVPKWSTLCFHQTWDVASFWKPSEARSRSLHNIWQVHNNKNPIATKQYKTSDTRSIQGYHLPSCAPSKAPSTRSDLT